MEVWKLSALMFTVLVYSVQSLSFTLNKEDWITDNWADTQGEPVQDRLAGLLKRSKSHQFYGLMGKRSETIQPVRIMNRRRHKGDVFVGLMGRRSLADPDTKTISDSSTRMDNTADLSNQSDLQVWNRLQYN